MRFAFVLLLAFVLDVDGIVHRSDQKGLDFWTLQTTIRQNLLLGYKAQHQLSSVSDKSLPETLVITQRLDHFNAQVKDTYGQRYWVNSEYWRPPHGPVFLYIGGEGGLNPNVAKYGAHVELAETYGALIFVVEHRFYGQSLNDDGLKLENLKYLSSQQALADLAAFHFQMTKTYNLTTMNKWISFGGSYPGSLSAWFRVKYPHLVHAAIASSAPVRAVVDFQGYNDVVAESLKTDLVGGSQKCVDMIRDAFRAVDNLLSNGNVTKVASDFLSCQPLAEEDLTMFAFTLAAFFMNIVQNNKVLSPGPNIKNICQTMTQGPDAYQNLVRFNQMYLAYKERECAMFSWKLYIQQLSNETLDRMEEGLVRQWTYQTCAQFGYFQTCDAEDCIFSRYVTLSRYLDICKIVYNIDSKEVYDRVDFTNSYYGSDHPQGSRILFVNGLIDPWKALSVLKNLSPTELAVVIPGVAHCADLAYDTCDDSAALTEAKKKICRQIRIWLTQPDQETTPLRLIPSKRYGAYGASLQKL